MKSDVYLKSACLCLGLCAANLALDRLLTPWIQDRSFRWATAFSALQVMAILCLATSLLGRRAYTRFRAGIQDQMRPSVEERVMGFALTGEGWSTRVPKDGAARRVLEQCIAHALTSLRDSGRDRVAQFACDHGFTAQWLKEFASGTPEQRKRAVRLLGCVSRITGVTALHDALKDEEPGVRVEAARALLVSGDAAAIELVFRSMLPENLLTRALLTSDLKRHAGYLLAHIIPGVLAGNDPSEIKNCLEYLAVWKRAMTSIDFTALLEQEPQPSFLPLLITLLPYASMPDDYMADRLLRALESASTNVDVEVQCAAARAAGQLKLRSLIPALGVLLPNRNARLAIAAATALAQMGTQGTRRLETMVAGPDRKAAAVALEALELITVGVS